VPASPSQLIVWMDLEMTGLDPARHRILEMASIVTDAHLQIVAEGPELVIYQPEEVLAGMNDWSREHHALSGLLDRVRASEVSEAEAEERTAVFLKAHCTEGAVPLGGNSVHLDRDFLQAQMRRVCELLHYTIVDVSTIKELVRRWYPDVLASAPRKTETHRALQDLRESIAELAHYRAHAFRPVEPEAAPQPPAEGGAT